MTNVLKYRNYIGSIEVSLEDNCLFGSVQFVNDLLMYEGNSPAELEEMFKATVDDYLETCAEMGKDPDKPFSGSFNVRIGPERHKKLAMLAIEKGENLNQLVCKALDGYFAHDGKPKITAHIHVTSSEAVKIRPEKPLWHTKPAQVIPLLKPAMN